MSEKIHNACPGALFTLPGDIKPGGTCDYCGTGIRYVYRVRSSDGIQFDCGGECVLKCDKDAHRQARAIRRDANRERKAAATRATRAELLVRQAADRQARLAASPFAQGLLGWLIFVADAGYPREFATDLFRRLLGGWAIADYEWRRLHELVTESSAPKINEWLGTIKQRQTVDVLVTRIHSFENYYGTAYIISMRTSSGHSLTWKTGSPGSMERAHRYEITATVKDHSVYNGEKQTVVTRCKVSA